MSHWPRGFVTSLLFPAPPPSYTIDSFPGELIWVPKGPVIDPDCAGANGVQSCESTPCLLLPYESARFIIIFFHSNAEDLGRCRWFCLFLRDQFQVHVLAVEYPGYGVCPGPISREACMANAHAALQFATQALKLPLERVKLFGRSIGTGPTLALASKFKVAGVILVTPFTSVRALFREKVGPLALMIEEWFPNDDNAKEVKSPTMIIHGRKDVLIPCSHGEALYHSCPTRKLFINPLNMEHNTNLATDVAVLIVPMFRFFALPDYSFQELQIPAWAFDKRRSPLYVRPEVQVASHSGQAALSAKQVVSSTMSMPVGDDADLPVAQDCEEEIQGRTQSACSDTPFIDAENFAVMTHPTVLHSYSATKQRYLFQGRNGTDASANRGASEIGSGHPRKPTDPDEVPSETIMAVRQSPLQDHGRYLVAAPLPASSGKPYSAGVVDGCDNGQLRPPKLHGRYALPQCAKSSRSIQGPRTAPKPGQVLLEEVPPEDGAFVPAIRTSAIEGRVPRPITRATTQPAMNTLPSPQPEPLPQPLPSSKLARGETIFAPTSGMLVAQSAREGHCLRKGDGRKDV